MAKVSRFEDLKVWKDAIQIGLKIYQLIENDQLIRD